MAVLICTLFAAGCNSGSDGAFIAAPGGGHTTTPGGTVSDGSVTFNFIRQQADQIVVPTNTVELRFEFFTGPDGMGSLVKRETRPYASSVTFENVPTSVNSTVVTAITAEGFPLTEFAADIVVKAGEDVTVGQTDGTTTPVTADALTSNPASVSVAVGDSFALTYTVIFSNGDQVPLSGDLSQYLTFTSASPSLVTANPDGTIDGVSEGATTVTATFQSSGASVNVSIKVGDGKTPVPTIESIEIVTVDGQPLVQPLVLPRGTQSQPITVRASYDGTNFVELPLAEVYFESTNPTSIYVDGDRIRVASDAGVHDSAVISAKYRDRTATVEVKVSAATIEAISANPASISLPFGGFETTVEVTGLYTDGLVYEPLAGNLSLSSSSSNFTSSVVNNTIRVVTAPNGTLAENEILTITDTESSLSTTVNVTVGKKFVSILKVTPSLVDGENALVPGAQEEFTVEATVTETGGSSNDVVIDVSDFEALKMTIVQTSTWLVGSGRQVVAVSGSGGDQATVVFTMPGAGENGTDAIGSASVEVRDELLVDATYYFAGNKIDATRTVNLPRGYVGVIEIEGTFNTGVKRYLTHAEYTVTATGDGTDDAEHALNVFDPDYELPPVNPLYIDGEYYKIDDGLTTGDGTSEHAVADDLYLGPPRKVVELGPDPVIPNVEHLGSNHDEVVTRPSFRAIVADWRRGEGKSGVEKGPDGKWKDLPSAVSGYLKDPASQPPQIDFDARNNQRFFLVEIDPSIIEQGSVLDNDPPYELSVTVTDPLTVEVVESKWKHYDDRHFLPVNSVREFEVFVKFGPSFVPPADEIPKFKLADANFILGDGGYMTGGAMGFMTRPTELGYIGLYRESPLDVAELFGYAAPVGGIRARPALEHGSEGPKLDGADYKAGTYEVAHFIFGVYDKVAEEVEMNEEDPFQYYDVGPGEPAQKDRSKSDPIDMIVVTETLLNDGDKIHVVEPVLVSISPVGNGAPFNIEVGQTQAFGTMITFPAIGAQPQITNDHSLDYPPRLYVNSSNPAFVSRSEAGNDVDPGRLLVSAISDSATNVTVADVDAQSGNNLMLVDNTDIINALTDHGIVIATDAFGQVITPYGEFTPLLPDYAGGTTGNSASFTKVHATPAP